MEKEQVQVNKTRTVPVTPVTDAWPEGGYAEPGSTFVDPDRTYPDHLLFACPGCGRFGSIPAKPGEKQAGAWKIESGELKEPTGLTLSPSIHCVGCCDWHGYLKNGVYESC